MTAEMILYIILSLLRADNANNLDNPQVHQHLVEVSQAIHTHATSTVPVERLISLAYNESRFGYRYVLKGTYPKSSWNACGIYQQVPKFSRIETTCKKLGTDVNHATKVAVAYLDYMIDRWGIRGSKRMDTRMCHYYSGNRCDAEARAYSKRHRKVRLKALKLKSKARRATRASTTTRTARNVRRITKEDLFSGFPTRKKTREEMTRKEWLYALRNEQDEKRRAELGLPPNKL
tara:strand:- start:31 stop:729 length:699 start_codon:yes stop_codon:yes gene_type:complete